MLPQSRNFRLGQEHRDVIQPSAPLARSRQIENSLTPNLEGIAAPGAATLRFWWQSRGNTAFTLHILIRTGRAARPEDSLLSRCLKVVQRTSFLFHINKSIVGLLKNHVPCQFPMYPYFKGHSLKANQTFTRRSRR